MVLKVELIVRAVQSIKSNVSAGGEGKSKSKLELSYCLCAGKDLTKKKRTGLPNTNS